MAETRPRADELLTLSDVARLTGLGEGGLKVQCNRGRITARKMGRDWVVTRGDLHQYLVERERAQPRPLLPAYVAPAGMKGVLDDGRVALLAARIAIDPEFMAYALARWRAAEQLGESEMAQVLGLRPDDLAAFRLYRRPDPEQASYVEDVRTIAGHYGVKVPDLDRVLRTYAPSGNPIPQAGGGAKEQAGGSMP